jgi:hypothetical protein
MKKYIIIVAVVIVVWLLYWLLPYKWMSGLRQPANYDECLLSGGSIAKNIVTEPCQYKGKIFYRTDETLK